MFGSGAVGVGGIASSTNGISVNGLFTVGSTGNSTTTGRAVHGTINPTNNFGVLWVGGDLFVSSNATTTASHQVARLSVGTDASDTFPLQVLGDSRIVGGLSVGSSGIVGTGTDGLLQVCNGACGSAGVATAAGELYVEGDIEADGNLDIGGTVTFVGLTGLIYGNGASAASATTTLSIVAGGTGATTHTVNSILLGNGTSPFTSTSTLSIVTGGTGAATFTAGGVLFGNGTSPFTFI